MNDQEKMDFKILNMEPPEIELPPDMHPLDVMTVTARITEQFYSDIRRGRPHLRRIK